MVALVMVCVVIVIFKLIISVYRRDNKYGSCFFQLFICGLIICASYCIAGAIAIVVDATSTKNMSKFKQICDTSSVKTDSITRNLSTEDFDLLQKIEKSGGTKYKFQQYYYEGIYTESNEFTWPLKKSYTFDPSIKRWELVLPK